MKKKTLFIIAGATVLIIAASIFLLHKNIELKKNRISIIDATYTCNEGYEKIYEDNDYVYSFPCFKSNSVFVKFPDNNKMLVTKALSEEKVTIDELIKAGLDVVKEKK